MLSKAGKVKLWEAAGPAATVEAVQKMYPTNSTPGDGSNGNDKGAAVAEAVNHSDGLNTVESNVEKEIQAGKMNAQDADDNNDDGDQKMEEAPPPPPPPPATLKETPSEVAAQVADSAEIIDGGDDDANRGEKKENEGTEKPSDVAAQVADSAAVADGGK